MKRITFLVALLVFVSFQLMAQKVITGNVTGQEDGNPIPGVSVVVRGTTIGTITDYDGNYSLDVPEDARILMFTFVGMKTVEEPIGDRTTIDVSLEVDILGLDEVVVTSLGITREKKALGYSVQDVSGDQIVTAREKNVLNSLQGRLSGVQISNATSNVVSGVRILIRGMSTFDGQNSPLFVVDGIPINNSTSALGGGGTDFGNAAQDLNPSDIENISVLKGANAAALYGSRAVNGVILVTTKTGKSGMRGKKGLGVTFETNWMWDKVATLPPYQNLYGQGSAGEFEYVDGQGLGTADHVDESWGPPMDTGLLIPQFDSPYDPETGVRQATPWVSHPDNVKDFFETGMARTTNLAIAGQGNKADFRLSLGNQQVSGILANTDLTKNTVAINAGMNVTNKLRVVGSATYYQTKSDNIVTNGYRGDNPMQSLGQWFGRQVDMNSLKTRWKEIDPVTGEPFNWNHNYHDNPFFVLHKNTNSWNKDRIIGNFSLQYDILDWLNFKGRVGTDWSVEDRKFRTAKGTNDDPEGGYEADSDRRNETTANAMLTMNRDIGSTGLNVVAALGGEYNHYDYQFHRTIVPDLIIPDLYAISNAAVAATTGLSETHTEIQSVFGTVNLGFRNYLFLDFTGRNDWSSTLPVDNNSYFYPSFSLGFIVTEALGMESNILSYAKIRGSYAEVGGTAGAYQLAGTYEASQPFAGNPSLTYDNTIPPLSLKPQRKKSIEAGLELKFLNNRIGIDGTFYKENTINQIMSIAISRVTGFTSQRINAGNLQNMGVEIQLYANPVQKTNFNWDVSLNWSTNENKVIELYKDMKYLYLYSGSWGTQVHARPGEEYGILWGYALVRENAKEVYYDKDKTDLSHIEYSGRPLIKQNGCYIRSNQMTNIGNVYPDWFGGINNMLSYKNFNLSFLIDFRKGGDVFSVTDWFGHQAGVLDGTTKTNDNGKNYRDPVADEGGVNANGVYGRVATDGTIVFMNADGEDVTSPVKNTTYTDADLFFHDWWYKPELSTFKASYVKLREVILGYSFRDLAFLDRIGISNLTLSFVGRNLWTIWTPMPNLDPEVAFSAGTTSVGFENNALPATRQFGFNLKFDF